MRYAAWRIVSNHYAKAITIPKRNQMTGRSGDPAVDRPHHLSSFLHVDSNVTHAANPFPVMRWRYDYSYLFVSKVKRFQSNVVSTNRHLRNAAKMIYWSRMHEDHGANVGVCHRQRRNHHQTERHTTYSLSQHRHSPPPAPLITTVLFAV